MNLYIKRKKYKPRSLVYSTPYGELYHGKSENITCSKPFEKYKRKVELIFTSPPFPLITKKSYGNEVNDAYVKWLSDFAPIFRELLTPTGSVVIELGNTWEKNKPFISLTIYKALMSFLENGKFNLCQEFINYNPSSLPSPVQWVNIEKIRVKDSFTRIWWMSKNLKTKANNKRILVPYSQAMKKLLDSQCYNSGKRPSQYNIGEKSFLKDNGGAIAPNIFKENQLFNNFLTVNPSFHQNYNRVCKQAKIKIHPARMSPVIPEFFIKFLTTDKDIILDPFAGSNTTGNVAEILKRKWVAVEKDETFALSSIVKFNNILELKKNRFLKYQKKISV